MDKKARNRARRWSGQAARDAIEDTERMGELVDRSPRTVRRWRDGEHPSPLTEFLEWMGKSEDPWRIAAHVTAFAKWSRLQGKTTAQLVERWHALTDHEHTAEAAENRAITNGDDAEDEVFCDEREAALLTERAAVRTLLQARGVNPRHYRRSP